MREIPYEEVRGYSIDKALEPEDGPNCPPGYQCIPNAAAKATPDAATPSNQPQEKLPELPTQLA